MQSQALVFERKQQVTIQQQAIPTLETNQVLAKAICSLVSTGTEGICYNRLFEEHSHWANWVRYPFYPGYSWIGEVIHLGENVTEFKIGDRVAARKGHASHHVLSVDEAIPVPRNVAVEHAAWFALAKIASMAGRAAEYRLGDTVAIIGAGPIGQMSTRWAAASGCRHITVIDPIAKRLDAARSGGATHVIDQPVQQAKPVLSQLFDEKMPDIVIDTTGAPAVFSEAIKLVRPFGKLILLGDTGDPEKQHLTSELLRNGIHIIGAHDIHNNEAWNDQTVSDFFFSLIQRGRFMMDGLNWHRFKPSDCAQAYKMISEHRADTMGILFDWSM